MIQQEVSKNVLGTSMCWTKELSKSSESRSTDCVAGLQNSVANFMIRMSTAKTPRKIQ